MVVSDLNAACATSLKTAVGDPASLDVFSASATEAWVDESPVSFPRGGASEPDVDGPRRRYDERACLRCAVQALRS